MKTSLTRCAFAVLACFGPLAAGAQTTPDTTSQVPQLDQIVVTASRSGQLEKNVLGNVTVIDRQTLQQAGQDSLADILGRQHGIQFASNGGPQTTTSVFMRGANADQTLVLLDGVPINGATSGLGALNAIPPASIDHVEILRGSASSLYGADAIGGVINIITKPDTDQPFSAYANAGVGTYATSKYSAGMSGSADGWTYSLGSSYAQSGGYNATNDKNAYAYNPDADSYYSRNLNGSLAYEWRPGQKIGLQIYNSRINGGIDYDRYNPYNDRSVQTLDLYSLSSENQITSRWKSTLRYTYTQDKNRTIAADSDTTFSTRQDQYSWQNELQLAPQQKLVLAYEHLDQSVSGDIPSYNADFTPGPIINYDQTRRHNNAFTGVYTGQFGRNHLQASLRNDHDSQFGNAPTWGLSYGYDLTPGLRAYAAANTGFKTPTFNDLYYPGYSNPNLKPEKSRNFEAGLRYTGETTRLSAVVYQNKVRDLIAYDTLTFLPTNLDHATLRGATLSAEQRLGNTTLRASADFLDPRDDDTGNQLNRRARQIYRASAEQRLGAWKLGGEYMYVGKRYDDVANTIVLGGYGLVNLTAAYDFNRHFGVQVRWNNVLDKTYTQAYGYNTPGSNVFVNLSWRM
ncbi:TonB-dependent receptor [Candidimonas humi]|uniref:TonB-dependent receptor domain-containing protein n=1 Tax=Candidimonas humi TaxID=683355 RepID=A0ABV8P1N0_9BURK|nr:TonB-dependent receptor [Candidimonas humi]MBV6306432.1 TonB-dependent receptor [Candidimonas humi]